MPLDNSNEITLVDNDRKNHYEGTFGTDRYVPKPLGKRVYLEMEGTRKSGIIMASSRHQDAPQIKKCVKVSADCVVAKPDTYYLVNMNNRPEVVYGPDKIGYFMVWEHDLVTEYEKE
jgi:hypothetical protein